MIFSVDYIVMSEGGDKRVFSFVLVSHSNHFFITERHVFQDNKRLPKLNTAINNFPCFSIVLKTTNYL